jgi:tRNA-dihydrouridine synthase B
MKIGSLDIDAPVFLAPMAGITDKPMRELAQSFGEQVVAVSEMVPSNSQVALAGRSHIAPRAARMFSAVSGVGVNSVQIFGCDPSIMAESARMNESLGAGIIDINMGCPAPKIVKNKSGAELMREPELASRIIRAVVGAVKVPVSVKIRTGWDSSSVNAVEFARMAEGAGASFLAVHGRTRAQMYSGVVDLATIAAVKRAVKIPVIGNGDIVDPASARAMMDKTGVDGVMIGRAAIGAPWLPAHIAHYIRTGAVPAELAQGVRRAVLLRHLAAMISQYGEKAGVINFRKHLACYSRGIKGGAEFRRVANTLSSAGEVEQLAREYFC